MPDYITAGVGNGVITEAQARADWDATDPDLREQHEDGGFSIWTSGPNVRRLVEKRYRPIAPLTEPDGT